MLTQQEQRILSSTFLFAGCGPEELAPLPEEIRGEKRRYAKGGVIFSPDHFQKELGILLSGRVLVTKGDGDLVVSELETGDLFGAGAMFNEESEYVSTLTARTPCEILFFSQEAVQALIDRSPRIRYNYIRYLSCRIRFLSGKIDALIQGSGEKKLSSYLLRLMDGGGRVNPGCSMTELASRLNISRASLYRELQKLEVRGVLVREGKNIMIQKPEVLARL